MDLLDVARGPALWFALTVFVLGTAWRLANVLRRPRRPDLSPARDGAPGRAGAVTRAIASGLWPRRGFAPGTRTSSVNGYVFHLGLALVFFGYAPHIAFVRRLTGLSWPAFPDPVMYVAASMTIVALLLALWARLNDPVLKRISGADDMISWTVTFLPLVTGMAVATDPSVALLARDHVVYRTPLAVHLLTLELLLVWFPFGKLMHAVLYPFSRGATGLRFAHRGVSV